jgi:hypothetical protein
MPTMLEVEPEVASNIQVRARERGLSVDQYLLELMEQECAQLKTSNRLNSQERVRLLPEWAATHDVNGTPLSNDAISRDSVDGSPS